jgi:hypothetical protein
MPICKECESHFLKYYLEIAGNAEGLKEELPALYHNTPTCPTCGLIGDMKKSKLKDALGHIIARSDDPEVVSNFMTYYRKRGKDFKDGSSIAKAFFEIRDS